MITAMAQLGERCSLRIIKSRNSGFYLDAGDLGEILLPGTEYTPELHVGVDVSVFLYLDSSDRPIATRKMPLAMPGEIALLTCTAANDMGAFFDWGLPKELLVPYREQAKPMIPGRHYVVKVMIDEKSGRFVGSQRIARHLVSAAARYQDGARVQALLWGKTDLGYKAVIDGKYNGLFFANQVFQKLEYGQTVTAYVLETRSDGKLTLGLTEVGRKKITPMAQQFLEKLKETGELPLTDDSTPAAIQKHLGMSKKSFKQVVGQLYKQKKIALEPTRIVWIED
jgi:predicted RNA-binding protein (virulence factor B family)